MDFSPPGSSVHGDSPGKNTGVDCHALLQGIFQTQGLNPVPRCRQILYHLSHPGSPLGRWKEELKERGLLVGVRDGVGVEGQGEDSEWVRQDPL